MRTGFYKHPYATMVTVVFVFSLLVTAVYFFGLIPGERKSQPVFIRLLAITGILLITTVVTWIAAISLSLDTH